VDPRERGFLGNDFPFPTFFFLTYSFRHQKKKSRKKQKQKKTERDVPFLFLSNVDIRSTPFFFFKNNVPSPPHPINDHIITDLIFSKSVGNPLPFQSFLFFRLCCFFCSSCACGVLLLLSYAMRKLLEKFSFHFVQVAIMHARMIFSFWWSAMYLLQRL